MIWAYLVNINIYYLPFDLFFSEVWFLEGIKSLLFIFHDFFNEELLYPVE